MFKDPEESSYYLYYVGSSDIESDRAYMSIGVATGLDGFYFVKNSGNPLVSIGKQSITPALFKAENKYWIVFAFLMDEKSGSEYSCCRGSIGALEVHQSALEAGPQDKCIDENDVCRDTKLIDV